MISGHSAANIVIATAMQDNGLAVDQFWMLDAAIAMEAFDRAQPDDDSMVQPGWNQYLRRVWTYRWHANPALAAGDGRKRLTWNDCFSGVADKTYNFFSSSEDVLRRFDGELNMNLWKTLRAWQTDGRFAWVYQDKSKGRRYVTLIPFQGWVHVGSDYGGWQSSQNFFDAPPGSAPPRSATSAESIGFTNEELLTLPVFDPGFKIYAIYTQSTPPQFIQWNRTGHHPYAPLWISDLTGVDTSSASQTAHTYRDQLLAEMVPARALPAGANRVEALGDRGSFDMKAQFITDPERWPRDEDPDLGREWRHSDVKTVAYSHLYGLFDKMKTLGELDK